MSMPEGAQLSEDGKYWWDGSDWQPVPDGGGGGDAAQGGGGGLHQALASQGLNIAAEHADAGYVKQMYDHLKGWYDGLGPDDKAIFDALSQQGGDMILADPEVGVVNEGDPLVGAFAGTSNTLGESLNATGQALDQAQG